MQGFLRRRDRRRACGCSVISFGFKYGLPVDADLVADCRFLPNPHWVTELAPMTGQDAPVRDYVLVQPGAEEFLDRYYDLLKLSLPGYRARGQAVPDARGRLHRRQAPQRGHFAKSSRAARQRGPDGRQGRAPGPGSRVTDSSHPPRP